MLGVVRSILERNGPGGPAPLPMTMLALPTLLFVLRKVATFALLPVGLTILLLAAAILFKRIRFVVAALLVVGVGSMPIVSDALVGVLESRYPRLTVAECPPAEAVVVLGGTVVDWTEGQSRVEWSSAVDRFEQGVALVEKGRAPLLVLSGGRLDWLEGEPWEGDALRQAAIRRGVKAESIRVIRGVAVTADEARAVRELGMERVILVTSAFHMPRSVFLFKRAGVDVVPFPADYQTRSRFRFDPLSLVPQAAGLEKTELAVKEFYGLLYYRLAGGG